MVVHRPVSRETADTLEHVSSPDWAAFAPQFLVRAAHQDPEVLRHGSVLEFDAVVAFVDVAGFTPVSEALGAHGPEGTEDLTRVLNGWFDPVIADAVTRGGDVAAFAGDAITVLFPYGDSGRAAALASAHAWARDLTVLDGAVTTLAGEFVLRARVGIAAGPVTAFIVGGERLRLGVGGPPVDRAAQLETTADLGGIVVDDTLAAELADTRPIVGAATAGPAHPGSPPGLDRLLHRAIADRVRSGHAELIDEHRRVSTVFCQLPSVGLDEVPLRSFLDLGRDVLEIVDNAGGWLRQISLGDKGALAIAVFGAPVAHEDGAVRALACAAALRERIGETCRAGVTTGRVFAGLVGSELRRDYAVVGAAVNLAARLMVGAPPGVVVADAATVTAAGGRATWSDHRAVTPKGVEGETAVANLVAVRPAAERVTRELDVVGRERELAAARTFLQRTRAGRGGLIAIVGHAGTGKTALTDVVVNARGSDPDAVAAGAFEGVGDGTAYRGWWRPFRTILGVRGAGEGGRTELFGRLGNDHPGLLPLAPLVAALVGITAEETPTTSRLEADERRALTRDLAVNLISARCERGHLTIRLDDVHWADEPSLDLLAAVVASSASLPLAVVVTSRLPAPAVVARPDALIELGDLTDEAAIGLVSARLDRLGMGDVSGDVGAAIVRRAGGNPLYLERLSDLIVSMVEEGGDLPPLDALELPDDLETTVLARIDRLPGPSQTVLKLASVLGNRFPEPWLRDGFHTLLDANEIDRQLGLLAEADLLRVQTEGDHRVRVFAHAVVRDVAYGTVGRRTRGDLHASAGHHLAAVTPEDPALIAFHFGESTEQPHQLIWFERAADHARSSYDNEGALRWYERLEPLLAPDDRADVQLRRGAVLEHTGEWTTAEEAYLAACESVRTDVATRARAALGLLRTNTDPPRGRSMLEDCLRAAETLPPPVLVEVLEYVAWSRWEASDHAGALDAARRRLGIALRAGDRAGEGTARKSLGDVAWASGDLDLAIAELQLAAEIAAEVGDVTLAIHASTAMVGVHAERDDHRTAGRVLTGAVELASAIGYRHVLAILDGNRAELERLEGRASEALAVGLRALEGLVAVGDVGYVTLTHLANLADSVTLAGDVEGALEIFERLGALNARQPHPGLPSYFLQHAAACRAADEGRRAAALLAEGAAYAAEVGDRAGAIAIAIERAGLDGSPQPLHGLAAQATAPRERAGLAWARWRLEPAREGDRQLAATTYAELHASAPRLDYRVRHHELTGRSLTDPPSLPPSGLPTPAARAVVDAALAVISSIT